MPNAIAWRAPPAIAFALTGGIPFTLAVYLQYGVVPLSEGWTIAAQVLLLLLPATFAYGAVEFINRPIDDADTRALRRVGAVGATLLLIAAALIPAGSLSTQAQPLLLPLKGWILLGVATCIAYIAWLRRCRREPRVPSARNHRINLRVRRKRRI